MAGRRLARALEHAVQGIFVAWSYPVLAPKVQNTSISSWLCIYNRPTLNSSGPCGRAWALSSCSGPGIIIGMCTTVIIALKPTRGFPRRFRPVWGGAALSRADQQLLAGVGSRATGLARPKATMAGCSSSAMTSTQAA